MRTYIALASLFFCIPVHAQFYTGNDLFERLTSEEWIAKSFGGGFIGGVSDAVNGILVCPPRSVTLGQARDVVLIHLQNNPHLRHHPAAVLVVEALSKVWPCRR